MRREEKKIWITKSKSIGTIILMVVLIIVQICIYLDRVGTNNTNKIREAIQVSDTTSAIVKRSTKPNQDKPYFSKKQGQKRRIKPFDPNKIDSISILGLGFSPKQTMTILKYRNKGGRFHKPIDFKRLYVVNDKKYKELEPYIIIDTVALKTQYYKKAKAKTIYPKYNTQKSYQDYKLQNRYPKYSLDINKADSTSLDSLPGIGGYFASKIISYRKKLGFYVDLVQLLEIYNFGEERFNNLTNRIHISDSLPKIALFSADSSFLVNHPYIGAYRARSIRIYLEYTKENISINEIFNERVISSDKGGYLKEIFE